MYASRSGTTSYRFETLREIMAKASPSRSGDVLAGVAAETAEERVAAKMALADVPLSQFLSELVIPYEADDVSRLIVDSHDAGAFAPVSHMTVGAFRDWLLSEEVDAPVLAKLAPGVTPEMAAAVSKIMRNQDLILAARKVSVITRFRDTIGLPGRMSVRLQPNHPTDDKKGIAASIADGIMLNYQSTSFHDALYVREALGLKRAPEFEQWLMRAGVTDERGQLRPESPVHPLLQHAKGLAA